MSDGGLYRYSQEKLEEGGCWYFSRKEIEENSPSRQDGIDLKKEAYLCKSYCTFLQDFGIRLKAPSNNCYCNNFLSPILSSTIHAKNDRRMNYRYSLYVSCGEGGGDSPSTERRYSHFLMKLSIKRILKQFRGSSKRVVLATLGFDLNLLHPYKPLVDAIKKFKVAQNAFAQVAWNFVNDGNQMLELYEQNRVPASSNSEAEGSLVGGASHRATSKASSNNEEHVAPNNHSQTGGISTRLGNSNLMSRPVHEQPLADNHVGPPRTSQNHGSYHGSAEMRSASDHNIDGEPKDDLPYEIETLPQTSRLALDGLGNEDLERNVARSEIKDSGESKDKHFG
ncbi:hypothetical protein NC653_018940 [Populus alba x Populus x berolinensis]|uniref:Uncharacterized protein n=1 Tax=Populus alba x Populus x berolinensis TaxID=444605 RepID=A0AAD6VWF7_9ROSI|nr:hypothetical protein NC653_018940 [Populus alba x Populus x berolinensis]